MESRWLAFVSLILLLNFSFSTPSYSATTKHKPPVKQHHKQLTVARKTVTSKTVARRTATQKTVVHRTASRKTVTRKTAAAKTIVRKTANRRKTVTRVTRTLVANIWSTPINTSPYNAAVRNRINAKFKVGTASRFSPEDMVRAKVFVHYPLKGGIRKRTGDVRYLVLHSTETGRPADARTIVRSWNNIGPRHPGAQYIVDRDGTILQTADPAYATVHVNDRTALGGVNNDNSIGIEIVRTGKQKYTQKQLNSLVALVGYVKDRFNITRVCGHGEVQPSDRTDPVAFDWSRFAKNLASLQQNQGETQTAYNRLRDGSDG